MENENSPEIIETEVIEQDSLNVISQDLKDFFQFYKDDKDAINQKSEIEKQEKIEADILEQKQLEEQKIILQEQELKEKELIEKKEQELIDLENEFRENLLNSLEDTNLKLDEVITYNSKSDGFSDDVALVSQKMDLIIENTEHSDIQETNDNIASFADVSIIALVVIVLPIYVVYRFFKAILGNFLSAVI